MTDKAPNPDPPEPAPPAGTERTDVRVVVALAGPILFTPPMLALADRDGTVLGIPPLLVYVFTSWLVGIVLTALAARRAGR